MNPLGCPVASDLSGDPDDARVMDRYAQHLTERVGNDELAASSAQTYYNIISGFCSYCVRDGVLPSNPTRRDRAKNYQPTIAMVANSSGIPTPRAVSPLDRRSDLRGDRDGR